MHVYQGPLFDVPDEVIEDLLEPYFNMDVLDGDYGIPQPVYWWTIAGRDINSMDQAFEAWWADQAVAETFDSNPVIVLNDRQLTVVGVPQ